MKTKIIIITYCLLFTTIGFSQEKQKKSAFSDWERVTYKKDTIYLKFKKNEGNHRNYRGEKFYKADEKGIVFNLLKSGSLIYKDTSKSDTLCLLHLKDYKIVTIDDVEKKVNDFKSYTYKKLPPKDTDKLYQTYHKNDLFITYLIEVLENEEQFVVYPVIWRNQEEIQVNRRFGGSD